MQSMSKPEATEIVAMANLGLKNDRLPIELRAMMAYARAHILGEHPAEAMLNAIKGTNKENVLRWVESWGDAP